MFSVDIVKFNSIVDLSTEEHKKDKRFAFNNLS